MTQGIEKKQEIAGSFSKVVGTGHKWRMFVSDIIGETRFDLRHNIKTLNEIVFIPRLSLKTGEYQVIKCQVKADSNGNLHYELIFSNKDQQEEYKHKQQQKEKFTKPQSATFVSTQIEDPLYFGWQNRPLSTGVDFKQALVRRIPGQDGGTVNKPYVFQTEAAAQKYAKKKLIPNLEKLIECQNKNNEIEYNEVMVCLPYLPTKDAKLLIYGDDSEETENNKRDNRIAAIIRALDLKYNLNVKSQAEKIALDYNIPIYYYDGKTNSVEYTLEEQKKDLESLYKDNNDDPQYIIYSLFQDPEHINNIYDTDSLINVLICSEISFPTKLFLFKSLNLTNEKIKNFLKNKDNIEKLDINSALCLIEFLHVRDISVNEIIDEYIKKYLINSDENEDLFIFCSKSYVSNNIDLSKFICQKLEEYIGNNESLNNKIFSYLIQYNQTESITKILLNNKINIDFTNKNNMTPLMFAAKNGNTTVVEMLLEKGANIHAKDNNGYTPLIFAITSGNLHTVKKLLEKKASINHKYLGGLGAVALAAKYGHIDIVNMLLEKEENISNLSRYLIEAIKSNNIELVEFSRIAIN